MTKNDIITLALKILGIYCIIVAILTLRFTISMIFSFYVDQPSAPSLTSIIVGSLIPLVFLILLSYFLIAKSDTLSKLLIQNDDKEKIIQSFSLEDMQAIVFSVVGVIVIIWALPKLSQIVTQISFLKIHREDPLSIRIGQRLISDIIDVGFRLILGGYLFLGGRGLAKVWHKIHPLGDKQ